MKKSLPRPLIVVALLIASAGTSFAQNVDKVELFIRFIPPVSKTIEARCEAVTSIPVLKVMAGTRIKWKLKKDKDSPCESFNADYVKLQFFSYNDVDKRTPLSGIVNDDETGTPGESVGGHKHFFGDTAEGTVTRIASENTLYRYSVLLSGKVAQDPELEVSGTKETKGKK